VEDYGSGADIRIAAWLFLFVEDYEERGIKNTQL